MTIIYEMKLKLRIPLKLYHIEDDKFFENKIFYNIVGNKPQSIKSGEKKKKEKSEQWAI